MEEENVYIWVCTGHMAYAYAPWPRPYLLAYYVCGLFLRYVYQWPLFIRYEIN